MPTMKKVSSFSIALLLSVASALAGETLTVTSESGGDGAGTLRGVLADAGDGDAIVFGAGVKTILLDGDAGSDAEGLTVKGGDTGFATELRSLLGRHGVGGSDQPPETTDGFAQFAADIAKLPALAVSVGISSSYSTDTPGDSLIDFQTSGAAASLSGLAFEKMNFSLATAAVDNSGMEGDGALADSGDQRFGGVTRIVGENEESESNSLVFQNNAMEFTAGDARAGKGAGVEIVDGFLKTLKAASNAEAVFGLWGGGMNVNIAGDIGTITNSVFQNNDFTVRGGAAFGGSGEAKDADGDKYDIVEADTSATSHASILGGAVFVYEGNVEYSVVAGNSAKAMSGAALAADAFASSVDPAIVVNAMPLARSNATVAGVGAFIEKGDITGSAFVGNDGEAVAGEAVAGNGEARSDDKNRVYSYARAEAAIGGGGAEIEKGGAIDGTVFYGNSILGKAGEASAGTALGEPTSVNAIASAYGTAQGGGLSLVVTSGTNSVKNSLFQGNIATAQGGRATAGTFTVPDGGLWEKSLTYASAHAFAQGGGTYALAYTDIHDSLYAGNQARAIGGAYAEGGTSAADGSDNMFSWANADAYAMGGGAYFGAIDGKVVDSSFIGNSVFARAEGTVIQNGIERAAEAHALGGAIFFNTATGSPYSGMYELEATAGRKVVILGNTANGVRNGIHFGRGGIFDFETGYFHDSAGRIDFNVTAGGDIFLHDPITVEMFAMTQEGSQFNMTVCRADGALHWGGVNVMDANGGVTVEFEGESATTFMRNYTLTTTADKEYRGGSNTDSYRMEQGDNNLWVKAGADARLTFAADRDAGLALFDFTNSSEANFIADDGAVLSLDVSRQLLSVDASYLIADGIDNDQRRGFAAGDHITGFDAARDGQYWANAAYDSPYQQQIDAWNNLNNASPFLQDILGDRELIADGEFAAIAAILGGAVPDYAVNQANAGMHAANIVGVTALELAFRDFQLPSRRLPVASNSGYADLRGCAPSSGPRFWAGYLGNFGRVDSHRGYRGYRQNVNGALLGVNRDFEDLHSIGVYGGYTRGNVRQKGINSKVATDGWHIGLLGRSRPIGAMPEFAVVFDGGYTNFRNKGNRNDGVGRVHSKFHQHLWTVGLGMDYEISLGASSRLVPFATGRYTHLRQKAAKETGGMTATHVRGFNGKRFTTELGMRWSTDLAFGSSVATPWIKASWQHDFGDRNFSATANYLAGGALPTFSVRSVEMDANSANLGAGVNFVLNERRNISLNFGYNANISGNQVNHSVAAGFELKF